MASRKMVPIPGSEIRSFMRSAPALVRYTIFLPATIASVFNSSRMLVMMPDPGGTQPVDSDLRMELYFRDFSRLVCRLPVLSSLRPNLRSQNGPPLERSHVLEFRIRRSTRESDCSRIRSSLPRPCFRPALFCARRLAPYPRLHP